MHRYKILCVGVMLSLQIYCV